jgi:transposase
MAYHLIKEQCTYHELGGDYFDRLNEKYLIKRLTSRIETLGYEVTIKKELTAA